MPIMVSRYTFQQGRLSCSPQRWFGRAWRCKRRTCVTTTDIKSTHHFRVTWPFWTRFILKPTVGMELWPSISAWAWLIEGEVARSMLCGHRRYSAAVGLRYPAKVDVLNSELSALDGSQSRRPRRSSSVPVARALPKREETHRQNSQQRRLACVLQPDHGDVHFGCPAQ